MIVGKGDLLRTNELIFLNNVNGSRHGHKKIGLCRHAQGKVLIGLVVEIDANSKTPETTVNFNIRLPVRAEVKLIDIREKNFDRKFLAAGQGTPQAVLPPGIQRIDDHFPGVGITFGVVGIDQHAKAIIGVEVQPEGKRVPGGYPEVIDLFPRQYLHFERLGTTGYPKPDPVVIMHKSILPYHGACGYGGNDIDSLFTAIE